MQANNTPTKIPVPFADSGTKNTIPIPSQVGVTPGAASFTTGFPPLTFTPIAAGGVPPFGADFNGVLNAITQALRWANAGGQYLYDADFAGSIGGYPKGALVQRSTLDGFWLSTADNNMADPDIDGAGWVDPFFGRLINTRVFNTPGTSTYTPTPGTRSVVVEVLGAGGGSAATAATTATSVSAASGGGGGAYGVSRFVSGFNGVDVTVGAGGAGATNNTVPGGNGGTSSFGALLSATGGSGGAISTAINVSSIGATLRAQGGSTIAGANIYSAAGSPSGRGLLGSVTTLGGDGGRGGKGGFGGQGGGVQNQTGSGAASAGVNVGSGAGGGTGGISVASLAGAAGAPGQVIVWEYA